MKRTKTFAIVLSVTAVLLAGACKSKKNTSSSAPVASTPPPAANTNTTAPSTVAKSADGIYVPGEEELTAIQAKYKETTMAQLQEGHYLYTTGACINCHRAKNIYRYDETQWKDILEKMSDAAHLTATQKDAVSKYVFAIKAVQAK